MLVEQLTTPFTVLANGTITSPSGFRAAGVAAGLRKRNKKDVGLLMSDVPAAAAGVYTTNRVQAAPLRLTKATIGASRHLQALVVNSANANACTGEQGESDAREMQRLTAQKLSLDPSLVAVCSTGVIGVPLPMDRIREGITAAAAEIAGPGAASPEAGESFNTAILTTDTGTKRCGVTLTVDGHRVTIGGVAKGSGMIHPNMATMLGYVSTDAAIEPDVLQRLVSRANERTFNRITVDGDTSTNDCLLAMANGLAGNRSLDERHADWPAFEEAFTHVLRELAKQIARDGEGATKLIEVEVVRARDEDEAARVAKAIIGSSLVKTAVFGADANWGRILAAAGYSGVDIEPDRVDIDLAGVPVARGGMGLPFDEDVAKEALQADTIRLLVSLNQGAACATAWGCDLTYDYVRINAAYRT